MYNKSCVICRGNDSLHTAIKFWRQTTCQNDVIVVGAGVVGCSTARELSRYKLDVLVLEKGHDICAGASKANSGMIHAGYDPIRAQTKRKFNAPGSK